MDRTRRAVAARLGCLVLSLAALGTALTCCSDDRTPALTTSSSSLPSPSSSSAGTDQPSTAAPTATGSATGVSTVPDDLRKGSLERVFRSGELTVTVDYATALSTSQWTPSVAKPFRVTLSAINNTQQDQKIYVSKVTVNLAIADQTGPLDAPRSLVDTADITPGYIANFPYQYDQTFTVPAVDDGAVELIMTFNYELLVQVQKGSKDYAKQTADDTVRVPLS